MIFDNYKDDPSLKLTNKKKFVAEMVGISDRTAQRTINEMNKKEYRLSETEIFIKKMEATIRYIRKLNINNKNKKENSTINMIANELTQEIEELKIKINK